MASTAQLFHNAQPQQFLPANGARNPWTTSAQFQTKTTALPQKKPPTIQKSDFVQHDGTSKMWMPQPAQPVQLPQKTMKQTNLPAALHNAMADISPDEFIPVNAATRRWNLPQQQQPQVVVKAPVVKKLVPVEVAVVPQQVVPEEIPTAAASIEDEITTQNLYKTELCRSFEETGICRYGTKCQFAHGSNEIRPVLRHPKYKTEVCKTFHTIGTCPYGKRCRFIHSTVEAGPAPTPQAAPAAPPSFPRVDPKEWSTSWTVPAPVIQRPTPPPVFLAPETKNIVAENFLPSTAPVFLPPQFVQPVIQPVIQPIIPPVVLAKPEPLATVSVEPVPVAPVLVAPPAPAVLPVDSEEEDEDEDEGLSRRLSIFAQICSNDD